MKTSRFHPSLKSTLGPALLLLGLAASVNGSTVFQDTYTWGGSGITGDLNANYAARQSGGAVTSTYTDGYINGIGGSFHFLDSSSPMTPANDVMYLRTVTSPTVGTAESLSVVYLNTDFASSLSGKQWSGSYDALLTIGVGVWDSYLGFGLKSVAAGTTGPGNSDFFFAVKPTGAWLLWRNDGVDFTSGVLSGFNPGFQQYSVSYSVDESLATPLLSLSVTPFGGSTQALATGLSIAPLGANRYFGFLSSAVSPPTPNSGFSDARIDNLTLSAIPEPSGVALTALGLGLLTFNRRRHG